MYIDPHMLVDQVSIYKVHKDRYGNMAPDKTTRADLKQVRVDRAKVYRYQGDARVLVANMTIFIYPDITPVTLDDSYVDAVAVIDGQEYKVTNINQFSQPFSKDVFSYEVEVV